ncbi:MAG: hypothetical protein M3Z92_04040 [Bacteroidota bacterium]|nr:hypothetical protein [Bacteroidota bacterium]
MKQKFLHKLLKHSLVYRLLLILLLEAGTLSVKSQQTTLAAVGNQSGVPSEMKLAELKSIFMGEKQRWKNGRRIIIALMKTNTDIGKATSSKIYDMSGDELNKFWLALVFQGKAAAPSFFSSVGELENFIADNPGAIGILDKPINAPEVKSIIIDGQQVF